ncbi:unnamed protein product, partial [Tilletia laevis]
TVYPTPTISTPPNRADTLTVQLSRFSSSAKPWGGEFQAAQLNSLGTTGRVETDGGGGTSIPAHSESSRALRSPIERPTEARPW